MKNIILLLIFSFSNTNQLSCISNCHNIIIDSSKSFEEPSNKYQCKNNTHAIRCYGQLMSYYDDIGQQKYITYSFGSREHIIEKEMEKLADINDFKSIIYVLFLVESFDINELVITVYIICRTNDNCALKYIRNLFYFYSNQINPIYKLSSLLYNKNQSSTLICYNNEIKQIEICLTYKYPTCIINNRDQFLQGCYSNENTKLEYVLMITSSKKNFIEKIFQLIICNKNNCTEKSILKKIEIIVYNYTLGMNMLLNNSNKLKLYLFYFTYLYLKICFLLKD